MKRLLCLLVFISVTAMAQSTSGFHRVAQVITRGTSGATAQIVPNARVFVQNTNTGVAATIYSDPGLTITIPGAIVTSDSNGNYGYYAPLNICYTENISSPSQGSLVIPNICGNAGLPLPLGTLNGGTGTTTAPLSGQLLVGQLGSVYLPKTMIGDCTFAVTASITCLKTNGVSFTPAATTPIGTSGAVIPLLSSANTWGQNQTFSGSSTQGTSIVIQNTTGKIWGITSIGSSFPHAGRLDIYDVTDGQTALSMSNSIAEFSVPVTILGSNVCTSSNGACAVGSGTVTNFSTGSWPSWLTPSVSNSTTTPSLSVSASAIPNSALQNTSITINSVPCTLGGSCSIATGTSRTCNANGCYTIESDGTITEWGVASGCGTSNNTCTVGVTFPFPFTTTSNLAVVASGQDWSNCVAQPNSVGTTGFTMSYAPFVITGGGGANCSGGQTGPWIARGN